jgi:hypothetical protein
MYIQLGCVSEHSVGPRRRRGRKLAVSCYLSILYPWKFAGKLGAMLSIRQLFNL